SDTDKNHRIALAMARRAAWPQVRNPRTWGDDAHSHSIIGRNPLTAKSLPMQIPRGWRPPAGGLGCNDLLGEREDRWRDRQGKSVAQCGPTRHPSSACQICY